jgi:uncharacterized protein RhaS with RHS repeats
LGLYYLRARYYNPLTGRFLSHDPEDGKAKDPKTLHKYLYAGGDPVNAEDPKGRGILETGAIDYSWLLEDAPADIAVGIAVAKVYCWVDAVIVRIAKDLGSAAETGSLPEHACLLLGP